MKPRFFTVIAIIGIAIISLLFSGGCANIVPPQGGVRDSLPPIATRISPADSTLNFKGNRINLTFDEYVELDNVQQNLIVSPIPKTVPTITRKLNEVSIRLRDTLEENTTYTLNFGKSIKDVNEGNILLGYKYIFSTGAFLDSMKLSGKILLAETGAIDTSLTVLLYTSGEDSIITREQPRYVTKTDNKGHFLFTNLPPAKYYLYAIEDKGGAYRYGGDDLLFAFADSIQTSGMTPTPVTLYAFKGESEKVKTTATKPEAITRPKNAVDRRLKLATSLSDGKQDLLTRLSITFERIITAFDSTKVAFSTDSTFEPITTGYSWELDSTRKKLTFTYPWKEKTLYHLVMQKDFATDTFGYQLLRPDTIDFASRARNEYGKFNIRFRNLDTSKHQVLQVIQNNEIKKNYPLNSPNLVEPLVLPGEYSLRILEDRNQNGKWDPGQFFGKHIQPEISKPLQRTIGIKPNQDIPIEIDLNATVNPEAPPANPKGAPAPRNNRGANNRRF